jgi:hypothetical protein
MVNLLLAQTVTRPVGKWLHNLLSVVGETRLSASPTFWDEGLRKSEVVGVTIDDPLPDIEDGLFLVCKSCNCKGMKVEKTAAYSGRYELAVDNISTRLALPRKG